MPKVKSKLSDKSGIDIAQIAARTALDGKAEDLVILDVRGLASFTDYFVIMSGSSTRHAQGLAEAIEGELRSKRISSNTTEGLSDGHWILLDFTDVVVHIFYKETRQFYDLDGLWHDAPRVDPEEETR